MKISTATTVAVLLSLAATSLSVASFSPDRFRNLVGSKYSSAIKCYNDVLDWMLAQLSNYEVPKRIDDNIIKATKDLTKHLDVASKNAEVMSNEVGKEMEQYSAQVSQLEGKIRSQNGKVKVSQTIVKQKQKGVSLAVQQLKTAQANLQTHRNALAEARKREKKAKHDCLRRRRRFKRGLLKKLRRKLKKIVKKPFKIAKKIVKKPLKVTKKVLKKTISIHKKVLKKTISIPKKVLKKTAEEAKRLEKKVRKTVKKAICKTINLIARQIDKAKKDVKHAKATVSQSQSSHSRAIAEKNVAVNQLAASKAESQRLQQEKVKLTSALAVAKQKRNKLVDISGKVKRTLRHINELNAPSDVLKQSTELVYLLDVKNIVVPLKEIGSTVATLDGSSAATTFLPKLSDQQISSIREKLIAIDERGALSAEIEDSDSEEPSKSGTVEDTWDDLLEIRNGGEDVDTKAAQGLLDIIDTNVVMPGSKDKTSASAVKAQLVPPSAVVAKPAPSSKVAATAVRKGDADNLLERSTVDVISEADIDEDVVDTNIEY